MSIDEFEKAISNPAQSDKDFQQDTDDGLLFFHTHSLWEAMSKLEKFYECTIYGVLELEEIVENLRDCNAFYNDGSMENEDFICNIDKVSKDLWLEAMHSAYDNICGNYDGYEQYMEYIYEYVVEKLSSKSNGL